MMHAAVVGRIGLVLALAPLAGYAQAVILRLQCLQGEGAVHNAGGRSPRPAAVLVTDETGAPVAGAMVSFRLPEDGVSGTFTNGMRTDVAITGGDGVAAAPGVLWGSMAGPGTWRVTAAKDQARAGLLVAFFVAVAGGDRAAAAGPARQAGGTAAPRVGRAGPGAWRWLLPVAAGGAAALALGVARQHPAGGTGAAGAAASSQPAAVSIGAPSFTISKP